MENIMKKSVLILILLALMGSLGAQTLCYKYGDYYDDTIRLYRIIDDTHVLVKEHSVADLLGIDYVDFGFEMDIDRDKGEVLTLTTSRNKSYQFDIGSDCSLTPRTFDDFFLARDFMGSQVAQIDWSGIQNPPYGYRDPDCYYFLDSTHYFFQNENCCYLVEETKAGYDCLKLCDIGVRWSICATKYATGKLAFVDTNGFIHRVDYTDKNNIRVDEALWPAFRDACAAKDFDTVSILLTYQLRFYQTDPSTYIDWDQPYKIAWSYIAGTRDADFIIKCLEFKETLNPFGEIETPSLLDELIALNDPVLLDKILSWKPALALSTADSGMGRGACPVKQLLLDDNVALMRVMLNYFPDVNDVPLYSWKDFSESPYRDMHNMLTFAQSDEMKQLLIDAGVETLIPYTSDWYKETTLRDTNVNIRSEPGLTGAKIDKLYYGDKVTVLGVDPYFYDIDNYHGHWIQIEFKDGKVGFIFEKYLNQYFR